MMQRKMQSKQKSGTKATKLWLHATRLAPQTLLKSKKKPEILYFPN